MLLSLAGGVLGLGLGWWATRSVAAMNLDQLPRGYEIRLDGPSAILILAIAALIGAAIGLAPVVRLWRMNLSLELREESRGGTSSRRANLVRRTLAMAQVAIALLLLIGAGLLLASFRAVQHLDYGFQPDRVATATVALPAASYTDGPALVAFEQRSLDALRALPGVVAAGAISSVPFSGNNNFSVIVAEGYVMKPGESLLAPVGVVATAGYFEAMRIPVVRGRAFDARDTAAATPAIIVDERLARKFWPDQDPVGRHLYQPDDPKDVTKITKTTKLWNVVGVVREVQLIDPRADVTPVGTYYFPEEQLPVRGLTFTVRTRDAAGPTLNDVRRAIAAVDPQLPVFRVQPMQAWIDTALVGRRVPMLIATAFGGIALFLSAIGIYGVLAYSVTQRHRELGVRIALGGSASSVFALVLNDGLKIAGVGVAVGLAGAFFVGQVMKSQLFNVAPTSPMVLATVTLGLAAVALLASVIPALRASRINPIVALGR
jgi:putative ABC transport system permease protein